MNTQADKPRLFAFNLITLLVLGVALSFWTLYYTDVFPVVGGLLGLTGVFAWIGFMANMLTGERKKAMQGWFDQRVLQSHLPWLFALTLLGGFVGAIVARSGTLIIDSRTDDVVRMVSMRDARSGGGADGVFKRSQAPRSQSRTLLWTGWLRPARYRISAAGLPDVYVDIQPARRTELTLPDSGFSAPVVLVRADAGLSGIIEGGEFMLAVSRNGKPLGTVSPYRGHTVWVGAGRDVAIPQHLIMRWREEIAAEATDTVLAIWTVPEALAGEVPLDFGDRLRSAVVRTSDKLEVGAACRTVMAPASRVEYPQELVIHANGKC